MNKFLKSILFGVAVLTATSSYAESADSYPSKPIKLVVGFPPGGPTDIVGRIIAQHLARELKGNVIVENRGGASGVIGAGVVARAQPDGYTLLVGVESSNTRGAALNKLPYDPVKDFTYIRKVDKQRALVVVNPSLPVKSVKELIEYVKAHPAKVDFPGTYGASSHVGGLLFNLLNGLDMQFINYQGGSQPVTDVVSGLLPVGFFPESQVAGFVQSGKLRALAVAADVKSPGFPALPTIAEAGAAPMDASAWQSVVGPAGMPPEITKKISDAIGRMIVDKDFLAQLETIGGSAIPDSSPEKFTKEVPEEIAFWKKFVVDAKVPVNE